jgi:hypothetical protein
MHVDRRKGLLAFGWNTNSMHLRKVIRMHLCGQSCVL